MYRKYLLRLPISFVVFALFVGITESDVHAAEKLYYIHSDHLGSTSIVTDEGGNVVSQQSYYPYGETRASTSSLPTERAYTGQVSDADQTGLYYYNARYYNPTIAKFTQADTDQGPNRYHYVGNNPIKYLDPSGNIKCAPGWASDKYCKHEGGSESASASTPTATATSTPYATIPPDMTEEEKQAFFDSFFPPTVTPSAPKVNTSSGSGSASSGAINLDPSRLTLLPHPIPRTGYQYLKWTHDLKKLDSLRPRLSGLTPGDTNMPIVATYLIKDQALPPDQNLPPEFANYIVFDTGGRKVTSPYTGRDVGGGNYWTVFYADKDSVVLVNGIQINEGYTVRLNNLNVSPALLSEYQRLLAEGKLYQIPKDYLLGMAINNELGVMIEDTGLPHDPSNEEWY